MRPVSTFFDIQLSNSRGHLIIFVHKDYLSFLLIFLLYDRMEAGTRKVDENDIGIDNDTQNI